MEPVPEAERMEEFQQSPLPTLRLQNPSTALPPHETSSPESMKKPLVVQTPIQPRPQTQTHMFPSTQQSPAQSQSQRRSSSAEPPLFPTSPSSPSWSAAAAAAQLPYRPRTASPLSGFHSRSRSAAGLAPPAMSRTQSMPGVNGAGHILYSPQAHHHPAHAQQVQHLQLQMRRPSSPSGSPSRVRQHRKPSDDAFPPTSPVRMSVLDPTERRTITERNSSPNLGVSSPMTASTNSAASQQATSISRHRRPSSPLRQLPGHGLFQNAAATTTTIPSTPSSIASSPSYRAYDAFSSSYGMALSSVPSTPTSARSRSPSISSLETIPDSPDAEEAAMEAERLARLQAVAEEEEEAEEGSDSSDSNPRGRSSLDVPARGRTLGFGSRDKRKRWSVCGAERRGDIDLETIWED